jgi:hypothetical protein
VLLISIVSISDGVEDGSDVGVDSIGDVIVISVGVNVEVSLSSEPSILEDVGEAQPTTVRSIRAPKKRDIFMYFLQQER